MGSNLWLPPSLPFIILEVLFRFLAGISGDDEHLILVNVPFPESSSVSLVSSVKNKDNKLVPFYKNELSKINNFPHVTVGNLTFSKGVRN